MTRIIGHMTGAFIAYRVTLEDSFALLFLNDKYNLYSAVK